MEVAGVMEAAFAAGSVPVCIAGDWEDVQVELGLLPERVTRRALFPLFSGVVADGWKMPSGVTGGDGDAGRARGEARARERAAKRKNAEKQARKARKRGRR